MGHSGADREEYRIEQERQSEVACKMIEEQTIKNRVLGDLMADPDKLKVFLFDIIVQKYPGILIDILK